MMTIESQWRQKYGILKSFISSNPEIQIGQCEVCIPEAFRERFYECFDAVRRDAVEAWSSSFHFDVFSLSQRFIESENKLSETLHLDIELPYDLSSFLRNPREGMMRMIYNRLFELVQGKTTEDDFERTAKNDLVSGATDMFRIGYETWSALSLIILLEPDEFYGLALDGADRFVAADIEEISFGRQFHHPAKRIPEFILHSKRMNRLIAFKMPLTREVNSYYVPVEVPTQRLLRNRNGDSSDALDRRMIFLSVVPELEKTPIFADIHKRTVTGPDLSIEFGMERDLSEPEIIGQVRNRMEIMKPRLGAAMVLMDSKLESESVLMIENVDISSVGLEPSGFQFILDKLA